MTSILSTRPSAAEFPQAYAGYVASAPDGSVLASLETEGQATLAVLRGISQSPKVYAAAQRLNSLGICVLGAVVNGMDPHQVYTNTAALAAV